MNTSTAHLCDVEIEEVAVEDCLDAAGNDGDDVVERFSVVPATLTVIFTSGS